MRLSHSLSPSWRLRACSIVAPAVAARRSLVFTADATVSATISAVSWQCTRPGLSAASSRQTLDAVDPEVSCPGDDAEFADEVAGQVCGEVRVAGDRDHSEGFKVEEPPATVVVHPDGDQLRPRWWRVLIGRVRLLQCVAFDLPLGRLLGLLPRCGQEDGVGELRLDRVLGIRRLSTVGRVCPGFDEVGGEAA